MALLCRAQSAPQSRDEAHLDQPGQRPREVVGGQAELHVRATTSFRSSAAGCLHRGGRQLRSSARGPASTVGLERTACRRTDRRPAGRPRRPSRSRPRRSGRSDPAGRIGSVGRDVAHVHVGDQTARLAYPRRPTRRPTSSRRRPRRSGPPAPEQVDARRTRRRCRPASCTRSRSTRKRPALAARRPARAARPRSCRSASRSRPRRATGVPTSEDADHRRVESLGQPERALEDRRCCRRATSSSPAANASAGGLPNGEPIPATRTA